MVIALFIILINFQLNLKFHKNYNFLGCSFYVLYYLLNLRLYTYNKTTKSLYINLLLYDDQSSSIISNLNTFIVSISGQPKTAVPLG
jgi:hypothetical protein